MGRRSAWSSTPLCVDSAGACSSCAYPDLAEHNKTPVAAFRALTGVISSENGQAVFPSREGKLHCQGLLMQFRCGAQLKLMLSEIFLDTDDRRYLLLCCSERCSLEASFIRGEWWKVIGRNRRRALPRLRLRQACGATGPKARSAERVKPRVSLRALGTR
jgi:hypothetical protein